MKVVFMGTPAAVIPVLNSLTEAGQTVLAVYTRGDKPVGRGQGVEPPAVKQAALKVGLKVLQPRTFKNAEAVAEMAALDPELIIVAAYGLILPQSVLDIPRYGCVNIHPSLLPRHRGATPVPSAIIAGDMWTGVSLMRMEAGIDSGAVYSRAQVMLRGNECAPELTERLFSIGAQLLADILPDIKADRINARPQDDYAATYSAMITKDAGYIDWREAARVIDRKIRAYQPWPGAFTRYDGRVLKIIRAEACLAGEGLPGKVIETEDKVPAVLTGCGSLTLNTVQLEGKKPVNGREFARGARTFIGTVLD